MESSFGVSQINVADLFAGVGGFRLGLEGYNNPKHPEFNMPAAGPYKTVWANQWEPSGGAAKQFAWRCYEKRFGKGSCVNQDINKVLDAYQLGYIEIPDIDMVVAGFPCQDYSVAKPLSKAGGIEGKKGVLWWDIYRFLHLKKPKYVLLENVDRLLKSPASQRGRDFAIMLTCLANLGYVVEWRIVNSAKYGFPQRRKRVYIWAEIASTKQDLTELIKNGVLSSALQIVAPNVNDYSFIDLPKDPYTITQSVSSKSPFYSAGAMENFKVCTCDVIEDYKGSYKTLGDVIVPESKVPEMFYLQTQQIERWRYLKGAKSENRINKRTGLKYRYCEGSMAFPDLLTNPSRTILTGGGGSAASRFKHVIEIDGQYRRLVPEELEQLQGFPKGWTDIGMSDRQRAFCMGNALVVGIVHLIGKSAYYRFGGRI